MLLFVSITYTIHILLAGFIILQLKLASSKFLQDGLLASKATEDAGMLRSRSPNILQENLEANYQYCTYKKSKIPWGGRFSVTVG